MARPPKHPGSVVAHVVTLRLTEEEFRGLEEMMRRQRVALHTTGAGISTASFVRGLVRQALTAEGIEPGLLPPLPSPQAALPLDLAKTHVPTPVAMPKVPDGAAPLLFPSTRAPDPPPPPSLAPAPQAAPVPQASAPDAAPAPRRGVVTLRGARGVVEVVRRHRPGPGADLPPLPAPVSPPRAPPPPPEPSPGRGRGRPRRD